jgi:hypothetical protein
MGAFIVSMHIRTDDQESVAQTLRDMRVARARVTPPVNNWVSFYEETASMQDAGRICELTSALSARLGTVGIGVLIHDSDFSCHWLFDRGKQVDEYNSCPDYFGDDADWGDEEEPAAAGGEPEVLLRYCREGTTLSEVEAALVPALPFAEMQVERLANVLGIDVRHVLTDYNDFADGEAEDVETIAVGGDDDGPPPRRSMRGLSLFDPSGEDDEGEVGQAPAGFGTALEEMMRGMFGGRSTATADPRSAALLQAAVAGDAARIDELAAEGVDVNASGPMRMSGVLGMPAVNQSPQFEAAPLLAAVAHNRLDAARRLIELGADVHAVHPLFGSAVHVAVTTGAPDLLRLLLDHGADPNGRDLAGRTALQALAAHRQMIRQFSKIQSSLGSLGIAIPNMNLPQPPTPTEGWEECERILREAGGG